MQYSNSVSLFIRLKFKQGIPLQPALQLCPECFLSISLIYFYNFYLQRKNVSPITTPVATMAMQKLFWHFLKCLVNSN